MSGAIRFYGFPNFINAISKEGYTKAEGNKIKTHLKNGMKLGFILKNYNHLGYGIEYLKFIKKDETVSIAYINAGETYTPTLIRFKGNIHFTSVGDIVEMMEKNGYFAE